MGSRSSRNTFLRSLSSTNEDGYHGARTSISIMGIGSHGVMTTVLSGDSRCVFHFGGLNICSAIFFWSFASAVVAAMGLVALLLLLFIVARCDFHAAGRAVFGRAVLGRAVFGRATSSGCP